MIQTRSESYCQEIDDVFAMFEKIVDDVVDGKSALEIAGSTLPQFMAAVQGIDQIPAELKSNQVIFIRTAAARLGGIIGKFLQPKVAPVVPTVG